MSNLEKNKKKSKKKSQSKKSKSKKVEAKDSGEVLEKVMEGIEMAGASLDFFENGDAEVGDPEVIDENIEIGDPEPSEKDEIQLPDDQETEEIKAEDGEESENLELLENDNQEFIDQNQAYSIIESLLFSSDRPLGLGTFKQVFKGTSFKSKDIKKALEEMQSVYADPSRGVSLEEINGGWQLRTKVDNMDFLRKLAKARPFKLSGPALEVLAIIAYKQPIIKSEVDSIRGVESGHLVRALMEKHLVNFQGKSELPGKPMQYGTTKKFLEIFGLRNLRELPSLDEIDQLIPEGMGFEEEDEKLSDVTESLSENYDGNYSEGEEELVKIEDTLGAIDTSSEFFEEEKRRQKEKRDRDRAQDIREALAVGELVEAKDQRWLERYEEKIQAIEQEKQQAEELAAAEQDSQDEFRGELESLANENLVSDEVIQQDNNLEAAEQQSTEELMADSDDVSPRVDNLMESLDQGVVDDDAGTTTDMESETFDPFNED